MCELSDEVINERHRLRLKYTELEEQYKRMTWTVVELSHDVTIRDEKLDQIRDIIIGKVKHPQDGLVTAEYELDAIRKIIDDKFFS